MVHQVKTEPSHEQDLFLFVLKTSSTPNGQQGGAQSSGERELDGCGSITAVSAAAGLGDGVSGSQEGSRFSLVAERRSQAAPCLQAHHSTDVEG